MGREIKRVALDFDWPLNQVWDGYVNPHYRECPDCEAGFSDAYEAIYKHVVKLLWDHVNIRKYGHYRRITEYLAGRKPRTSWGHDTHDAWSAVKKLGKLAGLPEKWYLCPTCDGEAIDPEAAEAYAAWEETEPPVGEGWQLWENVSEGSPISPVFATKEELIAWLEGEGYSTLAATRFVEDGWAPSAVFVGGTMYADIEACAVMKEAKP